MKRFDKNKKIANPVMTILVSGIIGSFISILLMLLFSVLLISQVLTENALVLLAPLSCFLGTVVSAYLSSKAIGKTLLTSLVQAIFNIALAYFAGLIIFMRIVPQSLNLFCFLAYVVGAVLGGFISAFIRPRRHKIK